MSNNKLHFRIVVIIIFLLSSTSSARSEGSYSPPKMFENTTIQIYRPEVKSKIKSEPKTIDRYLSIKPQLKPAYTPDKHSHDIVDIPKEHNIGVSKVIQTALTVDAPSVEAQTLTQLSKAPYNQKKDAQTIETTIAFLPSSVELTNPQKAKFKNIIKTYFIERNANEIEIRVFATPEASGKQNSAKRRALARGLSVRDWLIDLSVKPEQITLKAIGASNDDGIPDRADIKILF